MSNEWIPTKGELIEVNDFGVWSKREFVVNEPRNTHGQWGVLNEREDAVRFYSSARPIQKEIDKEPSHDD